MQGPISDKVIRNTLYNTIGVVCISLVSLILTPYIIHYIGIKRFGIWVIVNVLIAYLGFLDFSMGSPIVKYVSEFFAVKDFIKLNQLLNTTFIFYLLLAIVVSIAGLICSSSIVHFFALTSTLYPEALFVIRLGIISFSFLIVFNAFSSVLLGLQYMDITNKILITGSVINIIGTVFVLKSGFGLRGLIINNLIVILISGVLSSFMVFKRLPALKFNLFEFKREIFKMLFAFGLKLHLGKLAFLVSFHMDKILLARFLNMNSVAFYELGSKITFTMRRLSLLLVSATMPAASEISVSRERSFLYDFYLRVSKYLILLSTPFFLFGIFNAGFILTAWLGKPYNESTLVIQVLALGYFVNVLTGVASTSALGVGKPGMEMRYSLLVAPLNIALSIVLILKYGLPGAAIGTSTALIIGAIYFFKMFHNYLSKPFRDVVYLLWKPLLACLLANILVLPINYLAHYWISMPLRVSSAVILLIKGVIFCLFYISILMAIKFFDRQDWELARRRWNFLYP